MEKISILSPKKSLIFGANIIIFPGGKVFDELGTKNHGSSIYLDIGTG